MDSPSAKFLIPVGKKGRFSLPAGFKTDGTTVVLTAGAPRCILLLQAQEWYPMQDIILHADRVAMERTGNPDPRIRTLVRLLVGFARECEVSRWGNIQVAPELLRFARIRDQLLWVPASRGIELWNPLEFSEERGRKVFDTLIAHAKKNLEVNG
jgi:division/cell wall cluster transcriptional repressor MraZ